MNFFYAGFFAGVATIAVLFAGPTVKGGTTGQAWAAFLSWAIVIAVLVAASLISQLGWP